MIMKNTVKKILSILLIISMVIGAVPVTSVFSNAVVYAADSTYSRINVQAGETAIYQLIKEQFNSSGQNIELVYNQTAATGDIVVYINGAETTYGEEGYGITVADGVVTVTAYTQSGAVYGLTDVLKQIEAGNVVSAVEPTQPFKAVRGLFVDCARKYFSVSWFENIIREMAWNGLNTLYISFSNDEGFRLLLDDMSLSFDDGSGNTVSYSDEFMSHMVDNPEQVSDSAFLATQNAGTTDGGLDRVVANYDNNSYLTQSDMEQIISYAQSYGINIIPEFNSPGHFGQVLWYFPNYRIIGRWYDQDGQPHYGLDLTKPEAVNFAQAFIKKYIDFFASKGCTEFCIGGDEYDQGNATNEQIAAYTNALTDYAESKGMTAYSWNDGQAASSSLLNDNVIVNCWDGPSTTYQSINFNQNYLYYVLKGYDWKPDAQELYNEWTPLTFANSNSNVVVADSDNILGSSLAIWCDVPNAETTDQILTNMTPIIEAFGYRMWNYELPTYIDTELPDPITLTEGYRLVRFLDSEAITNPTVTVFNGSGESMNWWYGGENLVDGNTSTWAWPYGNQTVGQYILIDLGSEQEIDTVTVASTNDDQCNSADVQVSLDGITWTTIGNIIPSNSLEDTFNVSENSIRYIRVKITDADTSKWWRLAEVSWTPSTIITDGTYIVVNGSDKAMTKESATDWYGKVGLGSQQVTISGNIAGPVNEIYEWTFARQSDGTYYVSDSDGKYLNVTTSSTYVSDNAMSLSVKYYDGKVLLYDATNNVGLNFYANQGQIYANYNTSTGDANNLQTLYKKVTTNSNINNEKLRNLITIARTYILAGNGDDRYDSEKFNALESQLSYATRIYLSAYSDQEFYNKDLTQDEIDAAVASLQTAIEELKLSDKTINYIEIPIEILDFRADGVLFEYANNTPYKGLYELLTDEKEYYGMLTFDYANETVHMPGAYGNRLDGGERYKRTGLIEEYLINGKPVYKEATVDYVAKLIAKGYFTNLSSSISNWNTNISNKITELYAGYDESSDTNSNLGSWEATIAKTSTQANGGDLLWNSIETCYDLSYYILNNLWRATDDNDGEDIYNMSIENRNTARLLYNEADEWYHLDSNKEMSYVGDYIYNTDLTTSNSDSVKFRPIDGLGYESSDKYGDTTDTTSGINYHFTVHAGGSFVYNADDNLYFYFEGDDDVYFFVNGQLVVDIGGAHGACDDELYLNDVAAEIGLVDGGIYTFDMFYADRHTTQTNLSFKTNIKVMDTMSTTSKGQYNAETGEAISYGAIVSEGTEVAYSFDLMNLRSVNITDITFVDDSLGAHISPSTIILYDENLTNGATTDIAEDIKVYYRTYDRPAPNENGIINSSTPVEKTVAEMVTMINEANSESSDGTATYRSIPTGSYLVDVQTEEELKTLLALGISIDTQISVYGFKRKVTENDRPYINTVLTNAYYTSNNERHALNGVASQKLTVINSFKYPTEIEKIVVDYGKPININIADITSNILLNDNVTATFYGITPSGAHNQTRLEATSILGTELNTQYTTPGKKGAYTLLGSENIATDIQMQLTDFLSEKEVIYAAYEIVDLALADTAYAKYYLLIAIEIYPATSVYYETDFADGVFSYSSSGWSEEIDTTGEDTVEVQDSGIIASGLTYGFDSSYENDSLLSNGSSQKAIGSADTDNDTYYTVTTTAEFTFTGTGFDLISRTGADQGLIKVTVTDSVTNEQKKKVTVLNKSESSLELYQIPVVSIEDLDYGTYDVLIEVDKKINHTNPILAPLNRGGEFYFDAVRINNPLMTDEAVAIYVADGEANAKLTEIRNMLIEAKDFDTLPENTESEDSTSEKINGAVFIDREQQIVSDIDTYTQIGPNNEVYLSPGYAIAFKIEADSLPSSVDIGAKIIRDGAATTLSAVITKDGMDLVKNKTEKSISSATSQFIDLIGSKDVSGLFEQNASTGKYEAYIVIKNASTEAEDSVNQLSITDLKIAYGSNVQTANYNLVVNNAVYDVATTYMTVESKDFNVKSAQFEESTSKLSSYTTMTVVTEADVDGLIVTSDWLTNPNAKLEVPIETSYVINEAGDKVWTVKVLLKYPGNRTYTVTGYISEGYEGVQAKDTIDTRIGGIVYEKKL